MFDVGFSELLVIAVVALIVLGPKRLPEAARTAGKWMAKLRRFVSEVRHDFDREMRNAEIMELQQLKQELDDTKRALADGSGQLMNQLSGPAEYSIAAPAKAAKKSTRATSRSKPTRTKKTIHGSSAKTRRR